MSRLARIRGPRPIFILAASLAGGAAYRFAKPASSNTTLDPHDFAPYILVEKQPVSSTNAIFTLKDGHGVSEPESVKEAWRRGVWSVEAKQPQLQIARSYTPLPPRPDEIEDEDGHELRFLIRRETGGEVSNYLHRLPEGSTVELRGPHLEQQLPQDVREVLFLAGGTGIAPAMQVAQALGQRPGTKMHLMWANRRREECDGGVSDEPVTNIAAQSSSWWSKLTRAEQVPTPEPPVRDNTISKKGLIVQELEALKQRKEGTTQDLSIQYYVDEETTFIKPADVAKRLHRDGEGSRLILVSGPDGFIEYWAGRKLWVDGREVQGPLGGALSKMDLKGWKVVKL